MTGVGLGIRMVLGMGQYGGGGDRVIWWGCISYGERGLGCICEKGCLGVVGERRGYWDWGEEGTGGVVWGLALVIGCWKRGEEGRGELNGVPKIGCADDSI